MQFFDFDGTRNEFERILNEVLHNIIRSSAIILFQQFILALLLHQLYIIDLQNCFECTMIRNGFGI